MCCRLSLASAELRSRAEASEKLEELLATSNKSLAGMKASYQAALAEASKKKRKVEELQGLLAKNDDACLELARVKSKHSEEVAAMQKEHNESLGRLGKEAVDERKRLARMLGEVEEKLQRRDCEVADLRVSTKWHEGMIARLSGELSRARGEVEDKQLKINALQERVELLRADKARARGEAEELTKSLAQQKEELNPCSISESDVDNDEGGSSTICATSFVDEIIEPLSKLNIDEDNLRKANASDHTPTEQGPVILSEECPNAQTLMPGKNVDGCIPWRSALSKIEVWYASYGSNTWKQRFLCYIEGGKVEGMNEPCPGSQDKSLPKDVIWKTVPHRLFFARSHTRTWGKGGTAFLHPESNESDKAYLCMYRITLEQFNDVLLQENGLGEEKDKSQGARMPLLDLSDIDVVAENKSWPLKALKDGRYSNVLYLGKEDNLPILTMTCLFSEIQQFKSLTLSGPSNDYMNALVRGLVEGKQLTREEAIAYINDAAVAEL